MQYSVLSISALVSELRIFLQHDFEERKCKTALRRKNLIEDIFSLMPNKTLYKKYFNKSKSPSAQIAKFIRRICNYAKLIHLISKKDIQNCAKGKVGLDPSWEASRKYHAAQRQIMLNDFFSKLCVLSEKRQKQILKEYRNCPINWLLEPSSANIFVEA